MKDHKLTDDPVKFDSLKKRPPNPIYPPVKMNTNILIQEIYSFNPVTFLKGKNVRTKLEINLRSRLSFGWRIV